MTTLICAGGSGTRVLESVLHLCAAGLGPDVLRILLIDPDAANGNTRRTRDLLTAYLKCHAEYGNKLGEARLFGTRIELIAGETNGQSLTVWSPVGSGNTFADILNYDLLSEGDRAKVHLFFTAQELKMPLEVGFRGHPSLGAATMALLTLFQKRQPWKDIIESIKQEVNTSEGSRFAVVGSVFGGTGASAIHPLVRFLRSIPTQNADKLKIGVVALAPYFHFRPGETANEEDAREAAKSEWFALATKAAVAYYDHLRQHQDWQFDAMYWLGDDGASDVTYSPGGPKQENPAHFVDLLAALAVLEFLATGKSANACYYSGPSENKDSPRANLLTWADIPLGGFSRETVKERILQLALVGAVHTGFLDELLQHVRLNPDAHCVPWYLDRFVKRQELLTAPANWSSIEIFSEYVRQRLVPWLDQLHSSAGTGRVRLFNSASWKPVDASFDMRRLANLLWPDQDEKASLDGVDRFFTDMVEKARSTGTGSPGAAYLAMVASAAGAFVRREYRQERGG